MSFKVQYEKPHASIYGFNEIELPDFTVITGLNGVGKTHFLEGIREGYSIIFLCHSRENGNLNKGRLGFPFSRE